MTSDVLGRFLFRYCSLFKTKVLQASLSRHVAASGINSDTQGHCGASLNHQVMDFKVMNLK